MITPLVSIIIPTYNRAHLIGETLDSIIAQNYTNWECIIIDDGSTDNSEQVIQNYIQNDNRFQYHPRPSNRPKGANACRNYGFEISKGEYINWFDSDDIMLEDFLKIRINKFDDLINMVICSGYSTDSQLNVLKKIDLNVESELFKDYTLWKLKIFTPSILFKKRFLLKFRLFNLNYHRGQETEFFSRLFYKLPNNEYEIINEPLFQYRQHQDSKTFRSKKYVKRYVKSLTLNSIVNMKRGVLLKDIEIIEFHYKLLLNYFFEGIDNGDKENAYLIVKQITLILSKTNFNRTIKFFVFSILILVLGIGKTKFKGILRNNIINKV